MCSETDLSKADTYESTYSGQPKKVKCQKNYGQEKKQLIFSSDCILQILTSNSLKCHSKPYYY